MKTKLNINCIHVISEPGDCTRYDYIILRDYDEFIIMPYKSTFKFPQRLNYYEIQDVIDIKTSIKYCNDNNMKDINPHTLLECVTTIKEIYNANSRKVIK